MTMGKQQRSAAKTATCSNSDHASNIHEHSTSYLDIIRAIGKHTYKLGQSHNLLTQRGMSQRGMHTGTMYYEVYMRTTITKTYSTPSKKSRGVFSKYTLKLVRDSRQIEAKARVSAGRRRIQTGVHVPAGCLVQECWLRRSTQ